MTHRWIVSAALFAATAIAGPSAVAQKPPASLQMGGRKSVTRFFITSRGSGRGGNLGGLAGADARCQALAKAEGSDDHTWRAYLSTMATRTAPAINARDRIGKGPWYNALGDRVAISVQQLHSDGNEINLENAVTERGDPVKLEVHDILTGSRPDGYCILWHRRSHLRELDLEQRRPRRGRSFRSHGAGRARALVELRARHARVQPAGSARDRRQRFVLLFRNRLTHDWGDRCQRTL